MAAHSPRRTTKRRIPWGYGRADGFIASLPRDEDWIATLRDEMEGDGAVSAFDAEPTTADWTAVRAALEEHHALLVDIASRVDALHELLASVVERPGTAASALRPGRDLAGVLGQAGRTALRLGTELTTRRRQAS